MSLGFTLQNLALVANARPWFPVEDYFNRDNSSTLGTSSDGTATWEIVTGNFLIDNQKVLAGVTTPTATPANTGIACIDILRSIPVDYRPTETSAASAQATVAPAANVELSAEVSPLGGDALYFRVKDANNWHRVLVDTNEIVDTVFDGYYDYTWTSSRGSSRFLSPYKDTAKYFPTLTTCRDTDHDHSTVIGPEQYNAYTSYITDFEPTLRKWGKYPYIAVKRGIRQGATGEDVEYLQGVMKYAGYYTDAIDGDFGAATDRALRALQAANDIIVDGYAWNLQTWLVIDKLAFDSMATDTAGGRGAESITSYVRRILLGNTFNWPNITVTGRSSTVPPETAYGDFVHTHDLLLGNCRHVVSIGAHKHYATNTYTGASVPQGTTTTVTRKEYRLRIQKCVAGSISNLDVKTYGVYDNLNSDPISQITLRAVGNYVEVSINNSDRIVMATWDASENPTFTKHGIGRGTSTSKGTSIDNFVCKPIESFVIPTEE